MHPHPHLTTTTGPSLYSIDLDYGVGFVAAVMSLAPATKMWAYTEFLPVSVVAVRINIVATNDAGSRSRLSEIEVWSPVLPTTLGLVDLSTTDASKRASGVGGPPLGAICERAPGAVAGADLVANPSSNLYVGDPYVSITLSAQLGSDKIPLAATDTIIFEVNPLLYDVSGPLTLTGTSGVESVAFTVTGVVGSPWSQIRLQRNGFGHNIKGGAGSPMMTFVIGGVLVGAGRGAAISDDVAVSVVNSASRITYARQMFLRATVATLAPTVTAVLGAQSPTAGGATLTLQGFLFGPRPLVWPGASAIKVGGVPCTSTARVSNVEVTCIVPAGSGAGLDIEVNTGYTFVETGKCDGAFTYAAPTVTRVETAAGVHFTGGSVTAQGLPGRDTVVTIQGTNFGPTPSQSSVAWTKGASNLACGVVSGVDNSVVCNLPSGYGPGWSLVVSAGNPPLGPNGQAITVAGFAWSPPTVTRVDPLPTAGTAGGHAGRLRFRRQRVQRRLVRRQHRRRRGQRLRPRLRHAHDLHPARRHRRRKTPFHHRGRRRGRLQPRQLPQPDPDLRDPRQNGWDRVRHHLGLPVWRGEPDGGHQLLL